MPATTSAAPSIRFAQDVRRFHVRMAGDARDRATCYRLRHEVFLEEMLGRRHPSGLERDVHDDGFDHLLITDIASGEPVGTCRLRVLPAGQRSCYSAAEFDLGDFPDTDGIKVEMGRTCLRRAYRNNLGLVALGRGVGAYAAGARATWLFGCTSVGTTDLRLVAALTAAFLAQGASIGSFGARPLDRHRMPGLAEAIAAGPDLADADGLVPPLLRTYLKAGARISAEPALDRDFGCVDYLTFLDLRSHGSGFLAYTAA